MERGIKQGCPIASYLYIIYIEPLIRKLNHELRGIAIGTANLKTSTYIDDLILFISDDQEIAQADLITQNFAKATNSLINYTKTKILGLGAWSNRKIWPPTWLQATNKITILGVIFSNTISLTARLNSDKIEKEIRRCITAAMQRRLTLHQRVQFFNTYAISRLSHAAKVIQFHKSIWYPDMDMFCLWCLHALLCRDGIAGIHTSRRRVAYWAHLAVNCHWLRNKIFH